MGSNWGHQRSDNAGKGQMSKLYKIYDKMKFLTLNFQKMSLSRLFMVNRGLARSRKVVSSIFYPYSIFINSVFFSFYVFDFMSNFWFFKMQPFFFRPVIKIFEHRSLKIRFDNMFDPESHFVYFGSDRIGFYFFRQSSSALVFPPPTLFFRIFKFLDQILNRLDWDSTVTLTEFTRHKTLEKNPVENFFENFEKIFFLEKYCFVRKIEQKFQEGSRLLT